MVGIDLTKAKCLPNTSETLNFNTYLSSCRTPEDIARANNLFTPSINEFKDTFAQLRAEFDNLIIAGDNMTVMANLAGSSSSEVNNQLDALSKKKAMLMSEIKATRSQSEAMDKSFMDTIMHGNPEEELAPSLQDGSLLLFWFSWLIITITLVMVRWGSPQGTWKAGLFTFCIMTLVTLCLYALMREVA
jgi:hypothetical protein